ncbi:MAG: PDZ domain-containing protein [Phycisphaerales bacterium]|nr:PDZ domain-containing protein [Phycisphaerales bacterium]
MMRSSIIRRLSSRGGISVAALAAAVLAAPVTVFGDDVSPPAGMMRYADVSATHIVFAYANDLWIVPREGGAASPLASPPGAEQFPRFSADGKTIAFMGNYDGGRDLYTIAVDGGAPTRVTHHPSGETLCDWTPDGDLLFSSAGLSGLGRMPRLFTVPTGGGLPEALPVPYGAAGAISDDGTWLAYTPHSRDARTWKRYRGGMATDIWLFNLKTNESRRMTDWEGTDTQPMWHGSKVYYLSDDGPAHRLNIWSYDTRTKRRKQVTDYSDFDVKWPAIGPGPRGKGEIIFENGVSLHLLDLGTEKISEVEITVPGDRRAVRSKLTDVRGQIMGWGISSTGQRAAVEARGDIWTLPAENGVPRNLTATDGTAERSPAWSPDGRWIAYFSDATGEYELYVTQSDGKGETRQLTDDGGPFKMGCMWSPDSKHILYLDKTGTGFLVNLESGERTEVDRDPVAAENTTPPSFSQDSRWIAYAKTDPDSFQSRIWIYNVETGEKRAVTSDMMGPRTPVFDRKGDYLFYQATLNFSPTYSTVDNSFIYDDSTVLLAVPLRADVEYPWTPKVDEEKWKDEKKADDEKADGDKKGDDEKAGDDTKGDDEGDDDAKGGDERGPAGHADAVSGTWNGSVEVPEMGQLDFSLTLTLAEDNSVSGTLSSMMFSGDVSGSWNPGSKKLALSVSIADGPTVEFDLTVDGESLSGTATADGEAVAISATRAAPDTDADDGEDGSGDTAKGRKGKKDKDKPVVIEFDGFESRAFRLPVPPGTFGQMAVNDKNQLIYSRRGSGIKLFDLKDDAKAEKNVGGGGGFDLSADGKKLLIARGRGAAIQNAGAGGSAKDVSTSGMMARIDPHDEWRQIFHDVWLLFRDFFYVDNMHGVDWTAMRDHYAPMVDHCVSRDDLNFVIGEFIAELNCGHSYRGGGDNDDDQSFMSVGMLGCDFELVDGAYRIARIHEGAPWDADARGPLSVPGLKVAAGDYILAVNGTPIDVDQDPWAAFIGTAGRPTTLTVSAKPEMDDDAREIIVEPIGNEGGLRYRAWIESNRKRVEELSDGAVGYIYVPDTGVNGQNDLFRQFYGQIGRKALIIDERWNGGGQIPTRFIELLNRPRTNYWARRDGKDWGWPPDSHQGPKCMLINGLAGSGGDMFPWLFKRAGLGKLIGTRTWGGLVGISGNPPLIDGGFIRVPTFGFYETDGTWGIEGHGVDPDIEVIDDPAKMVDGGDPQLEAAVNLMLDEIRKHPYTRPKRPADPDRSGMGVLDKDK